MTTGTLPPYLLGLARSGGWLDRPAVTDEVTGRVLRHADVYTLAAALGGALADAGVAPGDRVGFCVGDRAEWFPAFLACAHAGAVPLLVNPHVSEGLRESQYDVGAAAWRLDWHDDRLRLVRRDGDATAGTWTLDELAGAAPAVADLPALADAGTETLYAQFSSGTTGEAKAVFHRACDLPAYAGAVAALRLGPDDRIVSVSQLYFAYGFNNEFVYPMTSGAQAFLTAGRRSPDDVLHAVAGHRATLLFSVPSALAALDGRGVRGADLRGIVSAGEPLPASVEERVTAAFGVPVYEQIGCTEVGNAFCANGPGAYAPRSAGPVSPGYQVELRPSDSEHVVRLREQTGHDLGDIWVRGPSIPERVRTAGGPRQLLVDGWLPTGDFGYWNADGGLVVLGRRDDIVLVGGISVSAVAVENALRRTGLLTDVAVTTWLDERGASRLVALVVPREQQPVDDLAEQVARAVAGDLERFQMPSRYVPATAVPRTPSGKIQRHLVRAAVQDALTAVGA